MDEFMKIKNELTNNVNKLLIDLEIVNFKGLNIILYNSIINNIDFIEKYNINDFINVKKLKK